MTSLTKSMIGSLITVIIALGLSLQSVTAQNTKTMTMKGTDKMKFTVTEITAEPGQKIRVELTTVSEIPKSAMAHNFVLLKADADATAVANASARAANNEYIAPGMTDKMIAYSGMAGGGETVTVTFNAPEKPGKYEYICTFPGHYSGGMKGTLIVQ